MGLGGTPEAAGEGSSPAPLPGLGFYSEPPAGGSACAPEPTVLLTPVLLVSDQEHLDEEINNLRKELRVKVNRLFEAQGKHSCSGTFSVSGSRRGLSGGSRNS